MLWVGVLGRLDIYNLCNPPPPTSLLFFFLTPSIPCDIHSSAKCVWQALRLWAPSQWPLTLVCPDTRDEYLQDTEGKQAAMSGLYCVLPRLGTVSIIKQMTPEGCAPRGGRSRRRQSSGQKHLGRIFFFISSSLPPPFLWSCPRRKSGGGEELLYGTVQKCHPFETDRVRAQQCCGDALNYK